MPVLNWKHHTVIQSLMARGPLEDNEFRNMFMAVFGKNSGSYRKELNECLLEINRELLFVQLELRCCRNQNDGHVSYGLVNTVSDEQSKLGSKYTGPQIVFFKAIIESIIQDSEAQGGISTIDALNLQLENQTGRCSLSQDQVPAALRNFSISQKEKTLEELVQDKWLCYISDGCVGLGDRSYLDLRSWFHTSGIPSCPVCSEVGLKARVCDNEGCTFRIHQYCMERKFPKSKKELLCPSCGFPWRHQLPPTDRIKQDLEPSNHTEPEPPPVESARKRLRSSVRARKIV